MHTLAALGFLKRQGIARVSSRLIAKSVNTNPVVIRNLILSLKKAGLVDSKEGKDGGVSLARPPTKVSLQEIYLAVEETGVLRHNKNPEFKPCPVSRGMKKTLSPIFEEVDRAVVKALKNKTLQQIIDQISD